jgi:hypothetical protein
MAKPWAVRDAAAALLVALPFVVLGYTGSRPAVDPLVKMGPNTGLYLSGFAREYEISGLSATRWTTWQARVEPPVVLVRGPLELAYRCARVLPETAQVEVHLGGQLVDAFPARGGRWHERAVSLAAAPRALDVALSIDSHDRQGLGVNLDWIAWRAGPGARLAVSRGVLLRVVAFLVGLFVLLRVAGQGTFAALGLTLPWTLAATAWAAYDPYALAHVALRIALPGLAVGAAALALAWRVEARRWLLPIVVAAYLVKGAGWFHPRTFYPDVRNAERYVVALQAEEGGVAARSLAAQEKTNVGYPRYVGGRAYAFPYSPLMFMALGAAGEGDAVETAFRHLGLVAASLEPLLAFALARAVLPGSSGLPAALLAAFVPPLFSRLLLAMTATLVGHAWDALLAVALALHLRRPDRRSLALVAACALASQLLYVSSLFTVGALLSCTALLARRPELLAVLGLTSAITVAWLYLPFTVAFVTEILPAVARGEGGPPRAGAAAPGGPLAALARIPHFYGWAYPALAVAGGVLLRRAGDEGGPRLVRSYAAAFLLLLGLRAFGGGLFRDLKEITFVAPLVVVLTGLAVEEIRRRSRLAAALVLAGLVAYGLGRYGMWLEEYRSPFVQVTAR